MRYSSVVAGTFLERPNRFIARVKIGEKTETVHVKNTGRCKELLIPGAEVYLSQAANPERKTRYDLIAVKKIRPGSTPLLINMDSQIPNDAAEEWLKKGTLFSSQAVIRREIRYGNSRFDLSIEDGTEKYFMEVKGVTLEKSGTVLFPDAPTERGVKHIHELIDSLKDGYKAYVLFVVQMKGITVFRPNFAMHKEFGLALREAKKAGVRIIAMDCRITPDSIEIAEPVSVDLRFPAEYRKSFGASKYKQHNKQTGEKPCPTSRKS